MRSQNARFVAVIIGLLAVLVVIFGVSAVRGSQRPGELVFELESADAGTVPLGKAVVQRFPMRNVGNEPVTIAKGIASTLEGC